jgi:hypothetical protein
MTGSSGGYERALTSALLHPSTPTPVGIASPHGGNAERRFGVYRNNVVVGLVGALEHRFPVVRRLVGSEFFRGMARLFVELDPPRSPLLLRYGAGLPTFIETFPPAAALPYLADVARLEYARGEAYHAADAPPLPASVFAGLGEDAFVSTRVRLHPSATLLTSRFPVVSIWEANRHDGATAPLEWASEDALIVRPQLEVEVHRLPAGAHSFLSALRSGASIGQAVATAMVAAPEFDPAASFATLLRARLAIRIVKTEQA